MKTSPDNSDLIYDLQPDEFEKMVVELLQAEGYSIFDNLVLPREVDFIATKEEKRFAVLIKHRRSLSRQDVGEFFRRSEILQINLPRNLLFVTSARISEEQAIRFRLTNTAYKLEILALDDLRKHLAAHTDIAERFLRGARRKRLFEKAKLLSSLFAVLVALLGGVLSNGLLSKKSQPLDARIQSVESALASIKGLEETLGKVRDDMVATETATRELNKKYAEAKELEKLTDVQLQALKETLQSEKWWRTAMNYVIGFVLGVASSMIASVILDRWKQRRMLQSDSSSENTPQSTIGNPQS
ncbi:MAG: restriction endonuclease [Limisphaerales bacterium]